MSNLLRALVILSIVLAAIVAMLPFNQPLSVDLSLEQPPPNWVLGSLAISASAVLGIPSAVGLLRLRKWGRALGLLTSMVLAVGLVAMYRSPIAAAAGPLVGGVLLASAIAWSLAVALSFLPNVAARLRA